MLIGRSRDIRLLVVYGYARLVGYTENFELVPDILESIDVEEGRIFTLHLRPGHKWSDGAPFTSEDFRYWWKDVANNPNLSPSGPPVDMLVNEEPPVFEVVDETTVRYTWPANNANFLPRLAGAAPLFIYRPAHFLKKYHADYATEAELEERIGRARNWAAQHNRQDNMYRFDNPSLPTLQPWMNTTRPPATRFKAERNPYFHRVDENGRQLPYIDRFIMSQATAQLIPAKAGAGEVDLQARSIYFNNYTFLRAAQNYETGGKVGEPPDMPAAIELQELHRQWLNAGSDEERTEVWGKMLSIHADQVFSIGVVSGVMQPIVVRNGLRNVPRKGIYNWDPGAQFGMYRPDTFFWDEATN